MPPVFRLGGVVFHRTDAFEAYEEYRRALEENEDDYRDAFGAPTMT